ncbi:MAG TPA: DUF1156 domain-containing protein [Methanoregulaceae archaeon]|jgi:adenine-specific DNA methylase|nr:DUF1156 domain-containing protein [Methanoregulaceae archaeon]
MPNPAYPKRLIEVDLPIKKISEHANREKSIRFGNISTLHIWWARRPLAACRAVICAALWPDPADPRCPDLFRREAEDLMRQFWNPMGLPNIEFSDPIILRRALLDFIADFSNWDNSTNDRYHSIARKLTQISHEALNGESENRPLVADPFAGGGSIPLEALRVGADAYASDLNPVAVLLNKVILEYIPKYGNELADNVQKWGKWVKQEVEKELAEFYPKDLDGSIPIAYLWARTIYCEGPGCGAEIPLIRSLWLAKKGNQSVALELIPDKEKKCVHFKIIEGCKAADVKEGTVKRGSATCPVCGYTTPVKSVRSQMKRNNGGANNSRLFCVVTTKPNTTGRFYRLPNERDIEVVHNAKKDLENRKKRWNGELFIVPNEPTPPGGGKGAGRAFSQRKYGMDKWEDLFTSRQLLYLIILTNKVNDIKNQLSDSDELKIPILTILGLGISRIAGINNSLCVWSQSRSQVVQIFTRQSISIYFDFTESSPFSEAAGDFNVTINNMQRIIRREAGQYLPGETNISSATKSSLPNDSINLFFTDPPYYDAVPYSDLSDFCYVWLKRSIGSLYKSLFNSLLTPKDDECIVDDSKGKDDDFFENCIAKATNEGRRILNPAGLGVIVFANKTTRGWEAILFAIINSGWTITASWPIDTERSNRLRAQDSAALASSIHLVCRPRENPDGSLREEIGDWRDILAELPARIHEWMPRLAKEGVVGADAIFACLGPALEIFSRYSRVEKASGEEVTLREYLEHVWAAVSREALGMIFEGADATGFEEDARITAMSYISHVSLKK